MDGAKVKNIIILVLLLVNLFLLAMVIHDQLETAELRQQAREDVAAAYERSGITLTGEVPWNDEVNTCSLYRDKSREHDMVRAILGKCSVQDLGGNILFYKSAKGEARFRGTGEFQLMPADGKAFVGESFLESAEAILNDMGFSADTDNAVIDQDGQTTNVTLACRFRGKNAYNCTVSFMFSTNSLLLIDGCRPMERGAEDETAALDAATVLMRFLAEVREKGLVCSEVRSVELGYMMTASASGEGYMTPFWRIVTDTGTNYMNGLTGKSESPV